MTPADPSTIRPALRPVTPAGILAARLSALATRGGTGTDLRAELTELARLAAGIEDYPQAHTTAESPALAALAARTRDRDWAGSAGLEAEMLSGQVEGQLLKMLVGVCGARRVLEIGMFTGYSALAMAEALPPDGVLVACEIDADLVAFAVGNLAVAPAGDRIEVRIGPAAQTLVELAAEDESFDLIFVDADKAGYAEYVDTVLTTDLLAPNGLLCVDNTLMQGQPWTGATTSNGEAIADFNDRLAIDDRIDRVLIPVRDGLTLIRRRPEG